MSFTIAMIHVFPSIETPSSRIQRTLEVPGIEGIIKPGAWTISGDEGSERKQQGKLE